MYNILNHLWNRRTVENCIALRARIVLLAHQKLQNIEIGKLVDVGRHCVGRWRRRWQDSFEALLGIQMNESQAALERAIMDVLRDAHRSGAACKFSAEQVVQLVSIACEDPRDSDRPIDDWTGRELSDEMQNRKVVDSISVSRVNELLRQIDLQPHRRKYWCFTTEKDPALFQSQVEAVCRTYTDAASTYHLHGIHTICVDEMTSLQANQRRAKTKLPRPGQVGKRECQYNRHGTLSLTGSWDVVKGQMVQTTINETRNGEDFAKHIEHTVATDPKAGWVVVLDNLNTHCGEPLVRTIAKLLGMDNDTLGKKTKRGILKSMKTRREFLSDPSHRIRFVFLPKHSSWLNQIEVVFGFVSKRVMRHGNFTSKEDLKTKLLSFMNYFNKTFAKPFNWTYNGKPTKSKHDKRPRTWREKTQTRKLEKILALVA